MSGGKKNAKKPVKIPPQRGAAGEKRVGAPRTLLPSAGRSDSRICWRFTHVDNEGPWGLAGLSQAETAELLAAMTKFESQTINELFHMGEWPGKCHDVDTLPSKEARDRLVALGLSDQTKVWKLRIGGPGRLWGFLIGNVFHVIWWDPRHEIWPSSR
ncbi:hypothetical protein ACWERV_16925 [Streptomyces sp. NPDC004031]